MDFFEALDRSAADFERRLRAVRADQWEAPTPCEQWSVRALVNHVVGANRMSVALLHGATSEEVVAAWGSDFLGDNPLASFLDSVAAQRAAFAEDGALERTCAHPTAGPIPGFQLFGFRIADQALHAWDLARAIGAGEQLDAEVVELLYGGMEPMADDLATGGIFGKGRSGTVPDDAPLQAKLLDLAGRRP
ncbi:MAG TPA: TIGR03086 family metal-binding protein [Acidimicrobiales bacterium]|nr:TIGR03086 family metal-binding protein [Acidimicrobiales bacterium]